MSREGSFVISWLIIFAMIIWAMVFVFTGNDAVERETDKARDIQEEVEIMRDTR